MRARLLERDAELGRLREALGRAGRGRGSVVLVSGEAGIGKTALVRAFADAARTQARVLAGVCDDLGTPRTLGPFRDMARAGGGPLVAAADAGAERDAVFDAVHRELAAEPTVLLVEDLHWADDATLDVVRWLAWRIAELPSLLVVTYRDDELAADAPMWRVLGALARQDTLRLELRPLSAAAVRELSGAAGADPGAVLGATGGNPFFVTEVLANPEVAVPATVRDAVLARLDGLGDATRRALQLLSVVPGRAERWLAERLDATPPPPSTRPSGAGSWRPTRAPSGSATSWPAGPSSRSCRPAPGSPATAGSWPPWPSGPGSSCPAWPTTPPRPASPSRWPATGWPRPARPPPPAPSPRPWPTTTSSSAGPACPLASGGPVCSRRASGSSTTCPGSRPR